MQEKKTIKELGEFGLIDHLTKNIVNGHKSTVFGVGDDAAVLNHKNNCTLVTTDLLLEGIHFDLIYTPLKHLGYKAVVVNISDIVAMNALPAQITVSIGISSRFTLEMVEELYEGIKLACETYNVDLVGGDTTASLTGLTISITCVGEAPENEIVYRSGASDTDIICVTGDLGAAYMGLQLLEREKRVLDDVKGVQPDFSGYEYVLQRQLKPEARVNIIQELKKQNIPVTAMMDISDGLSSELLHICKRSNCGCRIYEDRIPIDYETAKLAEEFNMNLVTAALNGGEDYELVFTVPVSAYEKVVMVDGVKVIGHITKPEIGACLITRGDGSEVPLVAQGWNSISK